MFKINQRALTQKSRYFTRETIFFGSSALCKVKFLFQFNFYQSKSFYQNYFLSTSQVSQIELRIQPNLIKKASSLPFLHIHRQLIFFFIELYPARTAHTYVSCTIHVSHMNELNADPCDVNLDIITVSSSFYACCCCQDDFLLCKS